MAYKKECVESTKQSKIVCKENRCKIIFDNSARKNIDKIKVDGCQITDSGLKCDFLVIRQAKGKETYLECYVELKGQDINHAVKQIERTITLLSKNVKGQTKMAFIISVRCPISSAKIQNIKVKLKRDYKCSLVIKNRVHTFKI